MSAVFTTSSHSIDSDDAELPVFDDNDTFTVCAWFKIVTDRNNYQNFIRCGNNLLETNSGGTQLTVYNGSSTGTGTDLTVGTWYHLAISHNGNTSDLIGWLNGVNDCSLTSAGSGGALELGNNQYTEWLDGKAFALKLWDVELSAAELVREAETIFPIRHQNLVSFNPLIRKNYDAGGPAAADITYTGTVSSWDDDHPSGVTWMPRVMVAVPSAGGASDATAGIATIEAAALEATAVSEVLATAGIATLEVAGLEATASSIVEATAGIATVEAAALEATAVSEVLATAGIACVEVAGLEATAVSEVLATAGIATLELAGLEAAATTGLTATAGIATLEIAALECTAFSDVFATAGIATIEIAGLELTAAVSGAATAEIAAIEIAALEATAFTDVFATAGIAALEIAALSASVGADFQAGLGSTFTIPAGGRTFNVPAGGRTFTIPAAN